MKFRRKHEIVDAEQFLIHEKPWPAGVKYGQPERFVREKMHFLRDEVGWHPVKDGDWIVTDKDGHQISYSAEIFRTLYEPVKKGRKRK